MGDIKEESKAPDTAKAMTVQELNEIVQTHKKDLYVFQEKVDKQEVIINELRGRLLETKIETKEEKKLSIPKKIVTVGKKKYKFNLAAFNLNGQVISSEDASLDEEILKQIVAMEGQGIMTEQV